MQALGRMASMEDAAESYHLDSLKQAFPYTREAPDPSSGGGGAGASKNFSVDQSGQEFTRQLEAVNASPVSPTTPSSRPSLCKADLSLYVSLPPSFPQQPPVLTTFGGTEVPIEWDPKTTLLSDAVREGFYTLRSWWGNENPPTLHHDVPAVPHFTDDVIDDLIHNPNGFDSYVYQLPYAKQLRHAEKSGLDDIELLMERGLGLQLEVASVEQEVDALCKVAEEQGEQLDEARKAAAGYLQYGTKESLLKALVAELKTVEQSSALLAEQYLHPNGALGVGLGSDNGSVATSSLMQDDEETLEHYFTSRCDYHELELKRRTYANSSSS